MSRSKFKGAYSQISNEDLDILYKKQKLKITNRSSTILPEYIGMKFEIHNGKEFKSCRITNNHVGHKFGEFAITKIPAVYKRKSLKKKKK